MAATLTYSYAGSTATITGYSVIDDGDIVVPAVDPVNSYPVVAIADNAFVDDGTVTGFDGTGATNLVYIGANAFRGTVIFEELVIPNSVNTIGNEAFNNCVEATGITLGTGLTSIGDSAFQSCGSNQAATALTLPNNIIRMGINAFKQHPITSLTIGTGLTGILANTFQTCGIADSLTIPDNIQVIGTEAFDENSMWPDISIGSGVVSVGDNIFGVVGGPTDPVNTSFTVDSNAAVAALRGDSGGAIINDSLETVVIGNNVTTIPTQAFDSCTALVNLTIGNNVTGIGTYAFYNCLALNNVTIPNGVTELPEACFAYCNLLDTFTFPNAVTTIGNDAFNGTAFTSVTIPNTVTSIGTYAFANCSALTDITFPQSCTNIGANVVDTCTSLVSIGITSNITTPAASNVKSGTVYGTNNGLTGTYSAGGGINGSGILGMI